MVFFVSWLADSLMGRTGLQTCVRRLAQSKVALAVPDVTSAVLNEDTLRICQCRGIVHGPVSTPSVNNRKRRDDCLDGPIAGILECCDRWRGY